MTFIAFRYLAIELSSLSVQNRHFHAASTLPCTKLTVLYAKRWDSVALPALKGARLREMSARHTEQARVLYRSACSVRRAAPRKCPFGRRASRLNAQPAPLPTASPRRPSRHRAPRAASSQPERRSRHRSRRAPKAARPARRSRPQGRCAVPVAAPLRRRGRCCRRIARTTPRSCKWTRSSSCWISRQTRAGRADAPAARYRRTAPPPGR